MSNRIKLNFKIYQGDDYNNTLTLFDDNDSPIDLEGKTAIMELRPRLREDDKRYPNASTNAPVLRLDTENGGVVLGSQGQLTVNITAEQSYNISYGVYKYDLQVIGDKTTTILYGDVRVIGEVSDVEYPYLEGSGPIYKGLPDNGSDGQFLAKASDEDYDVEWVNAPAGGEGSGGDVNLSNYYTKDETYNKGEVDALIDGVDINTDNLAKLDEPNAFTSGNHFQGTVNIDFGLHNGTHIFTKSTEYGGAGGELVRIQNDGTAKLHKDISEITDDDDLVNKWYVDEEISKVESGDINTDNLAKLDEPNFFTAPNNFVTDADTHNVVIRAKGLKDGEEDIIFDVQNWEDKDAFGRYLGRIEQKYDLVNKGYVDQESARYAGEYRSFKANYNCTFYYYAQNATNDTLATFQNGTGDMSCIQNTASGNQTTSFYVHYEDFIDKDGNTFDLQEALGVTNYTLEDDAAGIGQMVVVEDWYFVVNHKGREDMGRVKIVHDKGGYQHQSSGSPIVTPAAYFIFHGNFMSLSNGTQNSPVSLEIIYPNPDSISRKIARAKSADAAR